ncbi:hypothetical protein CRG98_029820 [Punica granatum]|nr:hypothetical protein CRG98_029820 [Punica granatum]
MPFLLSFFLFLNAGIWSTYALLVKDFFVGVPNFIGLVLGTVQLILYTKYKNKSRSEKSDKDVEKEEEGSAHLAREGIEMQGCEEEGDNQTNTNSRTLRKGSSLPTPSIIRQYSVGKFSRTLSVGSYEQHCDWYLDDENDHHGDLEGGKNGGS